MHPCNKLNCNNSLGILASHKERNKKNDWFIIKFLNLSDTTIEMLCQPPQLNIGKYIFFMFWPRHDPFRTLWPISLVLKSCLIKNIWTLKLHDWIQNNDKFSNLSGNNAWFNPLGPSVAQEQHQVYNHSHAWQYKVFAFKVNDALEQHI